MEVVSDPQVSNDETSVFGTVVANFWNESFDETGNWTGLAYAGIKGESPVPLPPRGLIVDGLEGYLQPPVAEFLEDHAEVVEVDQARTKIATGVEELAAPLGQLSASMQPVDMVALQRRVDEFFRLIDNLADHVGAGPMARLTTWLAAGAVISAAYAFVRRTNVLPAAYGALSVKGRRDSRNPSLSDDVILPGWDRS
jgi:hypothetical protein